jgi:hypothetical protein
MNKQVLTWVNDTLTGQLVELENNVEALCYTDAAKRTIALALSVKSSNMIGCLDELAKLTTRLATPKPDALLPLNEYSYQGSEALYDLLDSIRHEYRMMAFDLKDNGIDIDTSASTNNMLFPKAAS